MEVEKSMIDYNPKEIEKKWQNIWDSEKTFYTSNDKTKPKYYVLIEFPYPSGEGLHVGHPRPYTALDIMARKRRLEGYNVLFPFGFDAFGLPTENYAIKNKIHPKKVTEKNIAKFKKQSMALGFSFDWSREVNTSDPSYYKWTQWIFLKLFEKGLAYKKEMPINWCTDCKVGLANEEVVGGSCERCGSEVVRKNKSQWMLKITEYADKLIDDLDLVDYIPRVKTQQRNWIGRSVGMEIKFKLSTSEDYLTVFTTRPDTIFGTTYMVIAPEHPLLKTHQNRIKNIDELKEYRALASKKSDFERTELSKIKTGVEVKGIKAVNPVNNEELPIWVSDYVLMSYGLGTVMAVPGHDSRDWDFAKKFSLPIVEVITGGNVEKEAFTNTEDGIMINSDFINNLKVQDAIDKISDWLIQKDFGRKKINYKLRDWVFSRQRYWGEPIPLIYCEDCGWVAVPESELPLELPDVENYAPSDTGESPLANIREWVLAKCPDCGKIGRRETDTMPQWAGSSWYFLRYIDPHNNKEFASQEDLSYWLPVDWYNGGMEHTTLHLLYSRFWHKFLYDIGLVPTPEPYKKRTSQGMILTDSGEKMSKSRGNVINPDDIVNEFGADTLRLYEMFIGDFEKSVSWSENGVKGCRRFLDRVWRLQGLITKGDNYSKELESIIHRCIKKVNYDYENLKFNTAIASMMSMVNEFYNIKRINLAEFKALLILLNPVAPHITEELWQQLGLDGRVSDQKWLAWVDAKTVEAVIEIPVQINGKVRAKIKISKDASQQDAKDMALNEDIINSFIENKQIVKEIYLPGKVYNIVVK